MTDTAALIEALTNLRERWQRKLTDLEDMKSRGDLTADWGECSLTNARSVVADLAALASVAPVTPAPNKPDQLDTLMTAVKEACDLLAERKHGNAARSPGHNARLVLDSAIANVMLPDPPAPALWAPIAGRNGLTRDGRKVTGISAGPGGHRAWVGTLNGMTVCWYANGSYYSPNFPYPLDLVACADEVAG